MMSAHAVKVTTYSSKEEAQRRAERLSKRYGVAFAVWRGSDGSFTVTRANKRPPTITWAQVV